MRTSAMLEQHSIAIRGTNLLMDGTSTGEHGVGIGKKDYLPLELGEALDPNSIMNPGKIFDL
jgi:D-lactate dehydrogenase (cytochrome)